MCIRDSNKIKKGQNIVVLNQLANRDANRFDQPDELRLDRTDPSPISFGHGIHYCLGANLAKAELRAALPKLLDTLGDYSISPDEVVWRQPFPGPGLGVRIIGEVTPDKVQVLQDADHVVREVLRDAGLEREIFQSFAVLPDIRSVGVMGDERTYGYPIIVRAVTSEDVMTADWARIPYDVLETISSRVINEVEGVNRVAYDITSKPPGTIEWE